VALAWANSPLSDAYFELWHLDVGFDFGPLGLHMDLHHWVNDGLMVVFFFLIGLEVRQEFAHGSLRDRSRAGLALIAGVAGVVLPALVYVLLVGLAGGQGLHGWGAVVGTDTAFMLGTLAIVGPRLSGQLRVFLLTLTVVDDFLAVSIIGIVYSEEIRIVPLLIALASLVALWWLGRTRQWRAMPYVLIVIVLWLATVYSGIHASLAGMAAGLLIGAALVQPTLDGGRRLFGGGGQFRRKLRFNPAGFVQLDQPLAAHGLDRVVAVGDDQYVGREDDGAEHGQGRRQRHNQAKGSPARRERGKGCRHVACPES
jgi:Na+/H+ antiporter NhaA